MNFLEWGSEYLEQRGMFPDDASAIVEMWMADNSEMSGRWKESTDAYPPALRAVLSISLDRIALQWIDKNCPRAWYRSVFVRTAQ